ncbi:uncharacterized protein LOC136072935 [Hydra vulgaris]|uniref:uncharacterized protein LOC136072935 n=1 Tax=Hydra vulgaris TaxID=6087 RepID=UPI0032EA0899
MYITKLFRFSCQLLNINAFCTFRKLRKLVNENQTNWDEYVDIVLYPLRVERQQSTKVSPFEIMFSGRSPVCTSEFEENKIFVNATDDNITSEMEKSKLRIENLTNLVCKNIKDAQNKQKIHYDKKVLKCKKIEKESIDVEDKVLLLDIRGRRSKGAALKPRFKGPFIVSHVTQCGNFRLKDDKDDVNVTDLSNNDTSVKRTQSS